jgi:hypothetical protein
MVTSANSLGEKFADFFPSAGSLIDAPIRASAPSYFGKDKVMTDLYLSLALSLSLS